MVALTSLKRSRRCGIEEAMIITAASAPDQMRRFEHSPDECPRGQYVDEVSRSSS
jgi:hypothetical protein